MISTLTLIAIKAEPHIALSIISKNKLFANKFFIRKDYVLFLGSGIRTIS